jgi:hypothetical protein
MRFRGGQPERAQLTSEGASNTSSSASEIDLPDTQWVLWVAPWRLYATSRPSPEDNRTVGGVERASPGIRGTASSRLAGVAGMTAAARSRGTLRQGCSSNLSPRVSINHVPPAGRKTTSTNNKRTLKRVHVTLRDTSSRD